MQIMPIMSARVNATGKMDQKEADHKTQINPLKPKITHWVLVGGKWAPVGASRCQSGASGGHKNPILILILILTLTLKRILILKLKRILILTRILIKNIKEIKKKRVLRTLQKEVAFLSPRHWMMSRNIANNETVLLIRFSFLNISM